MQAFFREKPDGVEVFVRLTPKASVDRVEGKETSSDGRVHLAAKVRAVPDKGAANEALVKLIAKHFCAPKSTVSVIAGHTSRLKTILIEAPGQDTLEALRKIP